MLDSYHYVETHGDEGAPLIFTFHGTGGNEMQFHAAASDLVPGAHVISPRGDVSEHGSARFFRRKAEGVYDMEDLAARTDKMIAFIAAHKARVGAPEAFALGYSNGANIIASAMLKDGDLFDKAALLHPLIPWQPEPNATLAGKQVLITAGEHDPICPPHYTKALHDYLVAQGTDVSLQWHNGGHEIHPTEVDAIKAHFG